MSSNLAFIKQWAVYSEAMLPHDTLFSPWSNFGSGVWYMSREWVVANQLEPDLASVVTLESADVLVASDIGYFASLRRALSNES